MDSPKTAPYEWLTFAAASGPPAAPWTPEKLAEYRELFEAGRSFEDDNDYYMPEPQTTQEQPPEKDTAATTRTSPDSRLTARRLLSRPPSSSRGGRVLRPEADSFDPPTRRSTAPATSSPLRNVATLSGRTPNPEPIPSMSPRPPQTHDTGLTMFAIEQGSEDLRRRHTWGEASDSQTLQATASTVHGAVSTAPRRPVLKHTITPRSWKRIAPPQPSPEGDAKAAAFPLLGTALHKSAAQSEKTDASDGSSA